MSEPKSDADMMADAVARGITAEQLSEELTAAARRCWAAARHITGADLPRAYEACQGIAAFLDFVDANLAEIDNAVGISAAKVDGPGQKSSDKVYDAAFWAAFKKSPDELQADIDKLILTIDQEGMTPTRKAMLAAYGAVARGDAYLPPAYDPTTTWPGHRPPEPNDIIGS